MSHLPVSFLFPSFLRLEADLVCIIGEIQVKVIGKVRTGELIYTCPSDKFPGTATANHELGNYATQDGRGLSVIHSVNKPSTSLSMLYGASAVFVM